MLDRIKRVDMALSTPGSPRRDRIDQALCNQGETFLLVEAESEDASKRAEELTKDGWEIEAERPV